jgi:glutamate racemase
VPLVEEGWIDHPVTREVTGIYLDDLLSRAAEAGMTADTLVLGCTHYPLLRSVIEDSLREHTNGRTVRVIDSAHVTAEQAAARLALSSDRKREPAVRFYATDSVEKFRALGTRFLGRPIDDVELIDLGG